MKLPDHLTNPNMLFLITFCFGIIVWITCSLIAKYLDKWESNRKRKQRLKKLQESKEVFTELN